MSGVAKDHIINKHFVFYFYKVNTMSEAFIEKKKQKEEYKVETDTFQQTKLNELIVLCYIPCRGKM